MGEPPDRLIGAGASKVGISTVRKVATIQASYWGCMYPKGSLNSLNHAQQALADYVQGLRKCFGEIEFTVY